MNPPFTPPSGPAPNEEELLRQREVLRRGLRRANLAWVVIVAAIAALTFGVVWKAGQSAREAERANRSAIEAAQEAARASSETARAEAELWNARFTEAQALRIAGGRGARSTASRIVGELSRHAGLTELQRFALRAEAIAQLALVDLDPSADFNGGIVKNGPVWDAKLERYVTETGDGDVEIFETGSGRRLATFPVPRGFKRDGVVLSPDGQFLAGVFKRSQSRVLAWRIADGALVASNLTTSANGYDKPFFSPDSRTLGIYTAAALKLVSLDASMPAREFSRPVCASFSPDSRSLAVGSRTNLEIWSAATGEVRARIDPGFAPYILAWHPDGRRLAVGGPQGGLALWEPLNVGGAGARPSPGAETNEFSKAPDASQATGHFWLAAPEDGRAPQSGGQLRRLDGHWSLIVRLAFSPDGALLLSSAWDNFSSLWDVKSGRRLLAEPRVVFLQFGSDGRQLVTQTIPFTHRQIMPLLNRTGVRTVLQSDRLERRASGAAFSRDDRLVATDYLEFTRLWDAASGRELARVRGRSPLFLPDNKTLLTCTERGVFRHPLSEDSFTNGLSNPLPGVEILHRDRAAFPEDAFNALTLAPDDRTLVISASRAGVALLDLAGERPLRRLTNVIAHYASVTADGEWLVTQFHNDLAHLVSLTNNAPPRRIGAKLNTEFSPDGQRLAVAAAEELIFAGRNTTNGWSRLARVPLDPGFGANAILAFSPDSRLLAINTNRSDIHLFDVAGARAVAVFTAPPGAPLGGRSLAFSPDGRFLRVLRQDGELVEWDILVVRAELAKLGLDWGEATPAAAVTKAAELAGVRPSPGAETHEPERALESARTAGRSNLAAPGDGHAPRDSLANSLPAVVAGVAAVLALGAGVFVFFHQRRTLAAYTRAESLAAQQQGQLVHAQDALFQSRKMEALGTLAAGVAHDFNNLLSIIRMSKQLVDRAVKPDGVTKENLEAIEQAVHQGKSLVNSMLGYSRRPTEAIEDFTVAKVVGDTVALLSRQFLSGLTLNLQLDPSCPPVYGSRARLEQALLNLLVNASEAMNGSGVLTLTARKVEASAPPWPGVLQPRAASACVELSVSDTGPGIAPEVLPRVFEPFFTTKNVGTQRGTGLGLSLVYAIAQQDGWGLDLQSAPDRGTTFTLLLPASQTALTGRRLPTSQGAAASGNLGTH